MGILGVVVVLDEVELDVVLGTHLTKALGVFLACALGVLIFFPLKMDHTSLVEEQTSYWGIGLLPTQLHWH